MKLLRESNIRPERSFMETTQLYEIVNDVNEQTMGEQAIKAVDTASFIAMGNQVLSSATNTEPFLNTLVQRIGRSIISYRRYQSKLADMALTDVEWGAILQKVKVDMPQAVADASVELVDGESIDPYIVTKPVAHQKFFVVRSPYDFKITTQYRWLKEAFLSESAMMSFISAVNGEAQNALELSQENLAKMCMNNFIANTAETQKVKLLTMYNTASGESLTADEALLSESFLRYAVAQIKLKMIQMEMMSTQFNKEGLQRHTPREDQRFVVRADFQLAMETQVEYAAFHDEYVKLEDFIKVPYWQAADEPGNIIIGEEGDETEVENVIAFLHDRDALGTFRKETEVLTTPVNARGSYWNTFYHTNDARFNDMSENGIVFLLA